MDKEAAEIIDNLLTYLTMKESLTFDIDINKAQENLQNHEWVVNGLRYLQKHEDNGFSIILAHAEWIDRLFR